MASKLTTWINNQLKDKKISAKDAQKNAGKYKTIAAAKKAGSLYYTDKSGKVKIAAYASDLASDKKSSGIPKEEVKLPPERPESFKTFKGLGEDLHGVIITTELKDKPKASAKSDSPKSGGTAKDQGRSQRGSSTVTVGSVANLLRRAERAANQKVSGFTGGKSRVSRLKRHFETVKGISNAKMKQNELEFLTKRINKFFKKPFYRKGTLKKRLDMNMGGMMDKKKINPTTGMSMSMGGLSGRKVNPSTGLSMKKGGMVDYRKTGMMYGGGMARKR
jgi:hypothetical protein